MWKPLPHSCAYFLSSNIQHNEYFIYITDYINIWWVKYTDNEFLSILKKSNDDLEMENENELVEIGVKMLQYPEKLKKLNLNFDDKSLVVSMTLSHGFPIYLDMKLAEGSKEMFFKKITQQLLKTVHDLKISENELRFSLIKKDKEIEEYKSETDVRLAMYLKTPMFHDKEHMKKHVMYQTVFGTSDVPECMLQRSLDKTEDEVKVKKEAEIVVSDRVKLEPEQQIVKNERESQVPVIQEATLNPGTLKREIKSETKYISPKKKLLRI